MKLPQLLFIAAAGTLAVAAAGCKSSHKETAQCTMSGLSFDNFTDTIDGKPVSLYSFTNANGMEMCVTNFGGRIVSLMVPDKDGNPQDVVLGFDNIKDYETVPSDFGASIGRYGNRINNGRFAIDGTEYQLARNNGENPAYATDTVNEPKFLHTLHGGPQGWQYQVYDVKEVNDSSIVMVINAPDGENGFPGNVEATVRMTLTADNTVDIEYTATTDAPTVVNLTNHTYFNLNGKHDEPITNHTLQLAASGFTPINDFYIPLGEIAPVEGTPFDFTVAKPIGRDIAADDQQIKNGNGYDHNFVFDRDGDGLMQVGTLASPTTGIAMDILTTEPGIQFYSGNFLDGTVTGKYGIAYPQHTGVALETQHYPDSPNNPQWPSVVLRPGETYTTHTAYRFK